METFISTKIGLKDQAEVSQLYLAITLMGGPNETKLIRGEQTKAFQPQSTFRLRWQRSTSEWGPQVWISCLRHHRIPPARRAKNSCIPFSVDTAYVPTLHVSSTRGSTIIIVSLTILYPRALACNPGKTFKTKKPMKYKYKNGIFTKYYFGCNKCSSM